MILKITCCYNCPKRWMDGNTTCHASCARYIGEVERNNQIRKKIADSHEEFRYRYDRFGRISDGVMRNSNIAKFRNPKKGREK